MSVQGVAGPAYVEPFPHEWGNVDDCVRCIHCECPPWKGDRPCAARFTAEWVACWGCTTGRCEGQCVRGYVPRRVRA